MIPLGYVKYEEKENAYIVYREEWSYLTKYTRITQKLEKGIDLRWHPLLLNSKLRFASSWKKMAANSYDNAYGTAVAGKAPFPCGKDFPRMRRVVIPLIEEHMAETCANNSSNAYIYKQNAHPAFGHAFVLEHFGDNVEANPKTDGKHESIPSNSDKTVD